ncbi:GlxA family transcriptional regulator [Pseudohalocynthiibacter aestuariivivens]|uniref:GlxA family transcriptional regulator n=1 Tax=Roseovarius pelagicus TaxID=2980108 RepID=A0ABY6DEB8_9RHOB|nr:GlxA family transcriptional regulator [Roseovarius pelagicus]QIE45884.1 GlxA family transcriptional regulator [Pseudohalocynthiibacter aestuariivivens]UXX82160.1 GlxA family transcriptional regulator [Roseovarius pelagicus]
MQKWTKALDAPITIGFLIFDQFSNLCLSNCLEPLRAANAVARGQFFEWRILTLTGAAAQSSSGIQVLPHGALGDLERCDYLFVHASYGHDSHDTAPTRRALRRAAQQAGTIVGLDAGPWLMASAGLLDGRHATLHWDMLDAFAERFLEVEVERTRAVRDGPVITCAGAMSALDLTLDLISQHAGMATRLDVEDQFMHGNERTVPRDMPGGDTLVRRAVGLMRDHVERPLGLTQLARHLTCQPRTLDRRFRRALGAPPGTVYRHLRLSEARKLLDGTHLGIAEIAVRCGYESPAAMGRAMKARYGRSPTALRKYSHPT